MRQLKLSDYKIDFDGRYIVMLHSDKKVCASSLKDLKMLVDLWNSVYSEDLNRSFTLSQLESFDEDTKLIAA